MNTLRCIALWCLLHSLAPLQSQSAAPQSELNSQIDSALRTNNIALLDSLISANRLAIKPLVEGFLTQAMKSEAAGREEEFHALLTKADLVSSSFQTIHREKSLTRAVDDVRRWSKDERRVKLAADSLQARGTELRGKAETRDQALELYRTSLKLYRTLNDQRGEGTTLGSLGFIFWYKNDADQALHYFEDGLNVRSLVDDRLLIGNSYNDIGSVYYNFLKDFPRAIAYHQRALAVRKEIGDKSGIGRTLDNLALDYWDSGALAEAQRESEAAVRAHAAAGDQERVARSLHNSGILLTELGKYEEALARHDRSLDIRQKLGDKARIAGTFDAKGVVYNRMGEYESAYECYRRALSIMEELGDERGIAAASYKVGAVLSDLGRNEQAFSAYQRSLDLAQKTGDLPTALQTLSNMGMTYFDTKQYSKAEEVLKRALDMSRELHDYTAEIADLIGLGNSQNFQGTIDRARQNYQDALKKAQAMGNNELMWPALLGLGDLEEKQHDFESAIGHYTQALDCIEKTRRSIASEQYKISFSAKRHYVYEAVIHLLTKLHGHNPSAGYDSRAFRLSEGAKARAFLDLLSESLAGVREGADSLLLEKEDSLLARVGANQQRLDLLTQDAQNNRDTIASIKSALDGFERDLRRLESDIRKRNPRYASLKYPEPITIDDVQDNLLDPHTVLLEFSVSDSSTSLWVVTQREKHLFILPDRETVKNQVDVLRSAIAARPSADPETFRSCARRLYRMLLLPAEEWIAHGERLLIVPDGELNSVPFEVLLTDDSGKSFAELPYLLKRSPVVYVPSVSVLRSLRTQRRTVASAGEKDLIAFGDPVFSPPPDSASGERAGPDNSFAREPARLPHTGLEVHEIAKMFPEGRSDVFVREDATEERAKEKGLLTRYRFIHFATHGLINERRPNLSGLILARKRESHEDGLLRTSEIFNLRLSAHLVVLSACQTGVGSLTRGEGLIGLTRAFMYAGTPAVVVSLWNVADASTATLMKNFYEGMILKRQDTSEALRRAKLSLCSSEPYAHPFFWAPFVVVGDWRRE